ERPVGLLETLCAVRQRAVALEAVEELLVVRGELAQLPRATHQPPPGGLGDVDVDGHRLTPDLTGSAAACGACGASRPWPSRRAGHARTGPPPSPRRTSSPRVASRG